MKFERNIIHNNTFESDKIFKKPLIIGLKFETFNNKRIQLEEILSLSTNTFTFN